MAGIVHRVVVMHNDVPQTNDAPPFDLGYSAFVASDILRAASPRILKPRSVAHCSVLIAKQVAHRRGLPHHLEMLRRAQHVVQQRLVALLNGIEDRLVAKDRRLAIGIADRVLFDQVDCTPKQRRQLLAKVDKIQRAPRGVRLESDQQIDVAVGLRRPARDRAKERQLANPPTATKLGQRLAGREMIVSMAPPLSHKALAAPRHLRPVQS